MFRKSENIFLSFLSSVYLRGRSPSCDKTTDLVRKWTEAIIDPLVYRAKYRGNKRRLFYFSISG